MSFRLFLASLLVLATSVLSHAPALADEPPYWIRRLEGLELEDSQMRRYMVLKALDCGTSNCTILIQKLGTGEIQIVRIEVGEDPLEISEIARRAQRTDLGAESPVIRSYGKELYKYPSDTILPQQEVFRGEAYEFGSGGTLSKQIKHLNLGKHHLTDRQERAESIVGIYSDIIKILEAHSRLGLVHRDIKPGNMVLVLDPVTKKARLKMIDYDLAVPIGTVPPNISGTLNYMPPESFRAGNKAQLSQDAYALAVTLFEVVVGASPIPSFMSYAFEENLYESDSPDDHNRIKFTHRLTKDAKLRAAFKKWVSMRLRQVIRPREAVALYDARQFIEAGLNPDVEARMKGLRDVLFPTIEFNSVTGKVVRIYPLESPGIRCLVDVANSVRSLTAPTLGPRTVPSLAR